MQEKNSLSNPVPGNLSVIMKLNGSLPQIKYENPGKISTIE